jgi:hypothetical protein
VYTWPEPPEGEGDDPPSLSLLGLLGILFGSLVVMGLLGGAVYLLGA